MTAIEDRGISSVTLAVGGMTCASCAAGIEKKLNRIEGVTASVNFATEQATIAIPRHHERGRTRRRGRGDRLLRDTAGARDDRTRRARTVASTAAGVGGAERARGSAVDDSCASVRQLAVAGPRACVARCGLGRLAFPPRRVDEPAPPRRDDGHVDLRRRHGRLPVVGMGAARRWPSTPLSRGRRRGHHVHPGRSLLRGPREAPVRRRATGAARHGGEGRRRSARRFGRNTNPHRRTHGRRRVCGAARREGRDRRCGCLGHVGRRRVHDHRRGGAHRGRTRRQRCGCDRQCRWPAACSGQPRGRRDTARPDGPAGQRGPERQGRRAAAGGPDFGGLRSDRDRPLAADSGRLDSHRRIGKRGRHRRGRGADHRLPVCTGIGNAHCPVGGHRPRRPTRHPDQGPADPGIDAAHRHSGARQDGHCDHRTDVGHLRARRRGSVRRRNAATGGCTRKRVGTPHRAGGGLPRGQTRDRCQPSRISKTMAAVVLSVSSMAAPSLPGVWVGCT